MDLDGQPLETPVSVKMEKHLQAARRQRELHLDRLRAQGRPVDTDMRMGDGDVREIYNEWRNRPQQWTQRKEPESSQPCRKSVQHVSFSAERLQVLIA